VRCVTRDTPVPEFHKPNNHVLHCAPVTGIGKLRTQKPLWALLPQVVLTLLLASGLIQLTIWTSATLSKHFEANQAASSERQAIQDLQAEIAVLKERTQQAKTDNTYLERLARKQGFVKRGETVIVPKVR
jgi:cell division protein FtsB